MDDNAEEREPDDEVIGQQEDAEVQYAVEEHVDPDEEEEEAPAMAPQFNQMPPRPPRSGVRKSRSKTKKKKKREEEINIENIDPNLLQ